MCTALLSNELADRLLSPEFDKRKDLFLNFLANEKFDLMLSFSSGSSDIRYAKNS